VVRLIRIDLGRFSPFGRTSCVLIRFTNRSATGHHSFQATENGEGEDYTAELGLFEVAAEQVGEGPDLGGSLGEVGCHAGGLEGLQACSPVERGAVLGIITRSYP
jgi:hypothetical protein